MIWIHSTLHTSMKSLQGVFCVILPTNWKPRFFSSINKTIRGKIISTALIPLHELRNAVGKHSLLPHLQIQVRLTLHHVGLELQLKMRARRVHMTDCWNPVMDAVSSRITRKKSIQLITRPHWKSQHLWRPGPDLVPTAHLQQQCLRVCIGIGTTHATIRRTSFSGASLLI